MYGSAKEYAAENATLKKCETVLIPLFLLDGMIDIKYVVLSLLINKTFEGLRGIPDSNELCILGY